MKAAKLKATVPAGHKEDAVEVPFDPSDKWPIEALPLRPGRRAFLVRCGINDHEFQGAVVARSKKFWLLLPTAVEQAAAVACGDPIGVEMSGT